MSSQPNDFDRMPWETSGVREHVRSIGLEQHFWPGQERVGSRPTSGLADLLIGHEFPIEGLPDGSVTLVDYIGIDRSIAEAARTSYGSKTKTKLDNDQLIDYLVGHWHTTPLESCELRVLIRVPLFVIQQLLRQRTANINQESLRYSAPSEKRWSPPRTRLVKQSKTRKQCSGDDVLQRGAQDECLALIDEVNAKSRSAVARMEELDLAREVGRAAVTVNTYSVLSFKLDAHNLGQLLMLRLDPHAQPEMTNTVRVIHDIMLAWLPVTTMALRNHRIDALRLSADEVRRIAAYHAKRTASASSSGAVVVVTMTDESVLFAGLGERASAEFRAKLVRLGLL